MLMPTAILSLIPISTKTIEMTMLKPIIPQYARQNPAKENSSERLGTISLLRGM